MPTKRKRMSRSQRKQYERSLAERIYGAQTPEEIASLAREYADYTHGQLETPWKRFARGAIVGGIAGLSSRPKITVPLGAALGGAVGLLGGFGTNQSIRSPKELEEQLGIKGKGSYSKNTSGKLRKDILNTPYNPLPEMFAGNAPLSTEAELRNPYMTPSLREAIIRHRAAVKSFPQYGSGAFTAGGRKLVLGKIPLEHRPAVIAHELAHHRFKDVSKSLLGSLAALGAGVGSVIYLARKLDKAKATEKPILRAVPLLSGVTVGLVGSALKNLYDSRVAERRADQYAALKTSPEAIQKALVYLTQQGLERAEKNLEEELKNAKTRFRKRMIEKRLEKLRKRKETYFKAPEGRFQRAWQQLKADIRTQHPPMWRRLEYLEQMKRSLPPKPGDVV